MIGPIYLEGMYWSSDDKGDEISELDSEFPEGEFYLMSSDEEAEYEEGEYYPVLSSDEEGDLDSEFSECEFYPMSSNEEGEYIPFPRPLFLLVFLVFRCCTSVISVCPQMRKVSLLASIWKVSTTLCCLRMRKVSMRKVSTSPQCLLMMKTMMTALICLPGLSASGLMSLVITARKKS